MAQQTPAPAATGERFFQNRRNQMMVIGGVLAVVVLFGIIMLVSSMMGGGGADPEVTTPGAQMAAGTGDPGMGGDTSAPATGGDPGLDTSTGTGAPVAAAPGGAAPAPGAGPGESTVMAKAPPPSRADPFKPTPEVRRVRASLLRRIGEDANAIRRRMDALRDPPVPPPGHLEQWYELYKPPTLISNTATGTNEDQEPNVPYPPMRVAGIHMGGKIAAVLEVAGQILPELAVPGKSIMNGEFRVERISRDKVQLSRKVPGYTRRQKIEISMESAPVVAAPGVGGFPGGATGAPSFGAPGGSTGGGGGAPGIATP